MLAPITFNALCGRSIVTKLMHIFYGFYTKFFLHAAVRKSMSYLEKFGYVASIDSSFFLLFVLAIIKTYANDFITFFCIK